MTKVSPPRASINVPQCKACGQMADLRSISMTNALGYGFSTPDLCVSCLKELADAATAAVRGLAE